jgi:uncharacterized membrane protein YedE/YeeE
VSASTHAPIEPRGHGTLHAAAPRTAQPAVVLAALAIIAGLVFAVGRQNGVWGGGSARPLVLLGIGLALGATLLAFDFGFAGAFRKAVVDRDLSGLRAHLSTFALAMALIVPLVALGAGEGFSRGVGVTFLLGGGLFGVGMQLAGGCASGTLYQLGGGGQKHVGTLAGFVLGSVLAASHLERWWGLPALPPITLFSLGPWPLTLAIAIALMAAAFYALRGVAVPRRLLVGGALLAVLNAATVLASGHPWSETWAFTLWGSQAAAAAGVHPEHWRFFRDTAYDVSPFVDGTSIMDLAIPTGALLAAGVLGRFRLDPASPRAWAAATLGGLAMGYGARLSGGCNIGAYFSSIASGDLSGWAWALAALGGSALGVRLRARIETQARAAVLVA